MKKIILTSVCLIYFVIYPLRFDCYGEDKAKSILRFENNGNFKIVQFADLHERADENQKTIKLMEKILDYEKPDLVVLTGDNTLYCNYLHYNNVKAISNIISPMEKRKIPWAAVLGNHDTEGNDEYRKVIMKLYSAYSCNICKKGSNSCSYNIPILSSDSKKTAFNIYMLDSGSYSEDNKYSWIKQDDIEGYKKTSFDLMNKYKRKIPSLMFFHIPLKELNVAYNSNKLFGERNETECPQSKDIGLFTAICERKDVIGVFSGHDHTNDYIAKLNGIILGYGRVSGYNACAGDFKKGARVFLISESNPWEFKTWERLESDFK